MKVMLVKVRREEVIKKSGDGRIDNEYRHM